MFTWVSTTILCAPSSHRAIFSPHPALQSLSQSSNHQHTNLHYSRFQASQSFIKSIDNMSFTHSSNRFIHGSINHRVIHFIVIHVQFTIRWFTKKTTHHLIEVKSNAAVVERQQAENVQLLGNPVHLRTGVIGPLQPYLCILLLQSDRQHLFSRHSECLQIMARCFQDRNVT